MQVVGNEMEIKKSEENCEELRETFSLKEQRKQERYEGQHNYFRGKGHKSKSNYKNKRNKKC